MPAHLPPPSSNPVLISSYSGRADREGLARCMALAEQACQHIRASEDDRYAVQLAVEEACTNIVDHAYAAAAPGPLRLEFWLSQHGGQRQLTMLIQDEAPAFDPAQTQEPDLGASAEDRPIGGLGWFLIRQVMDEFEHTALAPAGNCLRLLKRLDEASRLQPGP